jgi:hypothetical protein
MQSPALFTSAVCALAAVLSVSVAAAQGTTPVPVPCRDSTCRLVFDWGGGQTASSYPQDRRYGSGDDFEAKVRFTLAGKGLRLTDDSKPGEVVITLRPRVKKAMCDAMSGTNTDMSCQTIGDLLINFTGGDATLKPPGAKNIRNSCGDVTVLMSMSQIGTYTGDLIAFYVEGEKKGERRPSPKC